MRLYKANRRQSAFGLLPEPESRHVCLLPHATWTTIEPCANEMPSATRELAKKMKTPLVPRSKHWQTWKPRDAP